MNVARTLIVFAVSLPPEEAQVALGRPGGDLTSITKTL
jgi:hypothetical protein